MSTSYSDLPSFHGEHMTFRQATRDRLLNEMLGSAKANDSKSAYKVLIMDKFTVKIMSHSCKMSEITDQGFPLVEDIYKRRQPMPSMDAVYFIQPSLDNVVMFVSDMSGGCPLYRKAYVFFSSAVPKQCLAHIKSDKSVLSRIGALSEMNLEYLAIDSQAFLTDQERALEDIFAENAEKSKYYNACLDTMAGRIATVFASLREFPYVRYRAAMCSADETTAVTLRDLFPTKLAAGVWDHLSKYRSTIPNFPKKETCELLIVDRSVDQIAPVIHEWFYDAMCHDLLNLEGSKFVYEVPSKLGGAPVKKEAILEDHDPLWLELRHVHIADASERLHDRMTNFISKNKAAQLQNGRDGGELSTKDMQKMVQALPEYSEQMDKLSLHVEIAGRINNMIRDLGLRDLGQLEQDLVFGDAGAKELINFLRMKQDANREDMLRLLMIYAAVYPDKMEGDKGSKLMQLARLSPEDAKAVKNMRYLASSDSKKATGGTFTLKFDMNRKKHSARKERQDEGETWALSRFYPMIEELIEKLSKGELSNDEYSCMNDLGATSHETSTGGSGRTTQSLPAQSVRARRGATWAKTRSSDSYSSGSFSSHSSNDFKNMGQRIFIFIIGGATRSELRSIHRLTSKLRREVVLGSSNICDPVQFITKLKLLNAHEVSLSNIRL